MLDPDSWKISKRLAEGFFINWPVQNADVIGSAFLDPHLSWTRGLHDELELSQNVFSLSGYLHIEPVPRLCQAQSNTPLVVCYDCHGGNVPPVVDEFKHFLRMPARAMELIESSMNGAALFSAGWIPSPIGRRGLDRREQDFTGRQVERLGERGRALGVVVALVKPSRTRRR
jgi:hypothetical protein